jgi:hypothetical protein
VDTDGLLLGVLVHAADTKPAPTFSDALAAVRRTLWADAASCTSRAGRKAAKVPCAVLDRLTDLACYAA